MKVKLILPALLEATDPGFRPIKYALFPPLGLAALAGYLDADDDVEPAEGQQPEEAEGEAHDSGGADGG